MSCLPSYSEPWRAQQRENHVRSAMDEDLGAEATKPGTPAQLSPAQGTLTNVRAAGKTHSVPRKPRMKMPSTQKVHSIVAAALDEPTGTGRAQAADGLPGNWRLPEDRLTSPRVLHTHGGLQTQSSAGTQGDWLRYNEPRLHASLGGWQSGFSITPRRPFEQHGAVGLGLGSALLSGSAAKGRGLSAPLSARW